MRPALTSGFLFCLRVAAFHSAQHIRLSHAWLATNTRITLRLFTLAVVNLRGYFGSVPSLISWRVFGNWLVFYQFSCYLLRIVKTNCERDHWCCDTTAFAYVLKPSWIRGIPLWRYHFPYCWSTILLVPWFCSITWWICALRCLRKISRWEALHLMQHFRIQPVIWEGTLVSISDMIVFWLQDLPFRLNERWPPKHRLFHWSSQQILLWSAVCLWNW